LESTKKTLGRRGSEGPHGRRSARSPHHRDAVRDARASDVERHADLWWLPRGSRADRAPERATEPDAQAASHLVIGLNRRPTGSISIANAPNLVLKAPTMLA
jgi:hypothetical protein